MYLLALVLALGGFSGIIALILLSERMERRQRRTLCDRIRKRGPKRTQEP